MKEETTLSVYIIIKQVSKMIIFTQLCKVQKYLVKKSQNFDLDPYKHDPYKHRRRWHLYLQGWSA